jgi:hypothetical protein
MFHDARFWFCSTVLAFACLAVGPEATWTVEAQQSKEHPSKEHQLKESAARSLTGCVDQQNGQYVLIDDRTVGVIAALEAVGFPQEGFAKHLGHKVTVKGTSSSKEGRPVFQVRSVEKVSDVCAPQQF